MPVGLFTGTMQENINIYELKTKNLSLPVTLSYNSNGLIVDKVASWVGFDLNLDAGGVITTTAKGARDQHVKLRDSLPDNIFTDYKNVISVTTTGSAPAAPTGLSATNLDAASFTANWSSVSGAVSYRLDVSVKRYYPANELFCNRYYDENAPNTADGTHWNEEYTDKSGRIVLKRAYDGTSVLSTYYVYDDFGLLRYVITPQTTISLDGSNNSIVSATELTLFC